jgi:hypothetical protein
MTATEKTPGPGEYYLKSFIDEQNVGYTILGKNRAEYSDFQNNPGISFYYLDFKIYIDFFLFKSFLVIFLKNILIILDLIYFNHLIKFNFI